MKTVIDNKNELIINKSRFISLIYNVNSIEDVNNKLKKVKEKYKDATHYCYAYIIDNFIKTNDDGEPSGTAGLPILNILQKENINHVLCVVVRYFGGIKLGAGGLIRAYGKATKLALITKDLEEGFLIVTSFSYQKLKEVEYLLSNSKIIDKNFEDIPNYKINITVDEFNKIIDKLKQISDVEVIQKIYM